MKGRSLEKLKEVGLRPWDVVWLGLSTFFTLEMVVIGHYLTGSPALAVSADLVAVVWGGAVAVKYMLLATRKEIDGHRITRGQRFAWGGSAVFALLFICAVGWAIIGTMPWYRAEFARNAAETFQARSKTSQALSENSRAISFYKQTLEVRDAPGFDIKWYGQMDIRLTVKGGVRAPEGYVTDNLSVSYLRQGDYPEALYWARQCLWATKQTGMGPSEDVLERFIRKLESAVGEAGP